MKNDVIDFLQLDINKLSYRIIAPSNFQTENFELRNKIFKCWLNIWTESFKELNVSKSIHSDNFSRQTYIGSLFYEETCVGLAAFRECNFNLDYAKTDSIFASWNANDITKLTKNGNQILVCSNLGVISNFRGPTNLTLSIKQILLFLATKHLLESNNDAMAGTSRCNKGVDKAAIKAGAVKIAKSSMHNVDVELVAFYKNDLKNFHDLNHFVIERLWKNKTNISKIEDKEVNTSKAKETA